MAFIAGQSGAGKTFVAVELAVALATGEPFFGRKVRERVGVVILAAEGAATLPHRIEGAKIGRGIRDRLPIVTLSEVPNLSDRREVDMLCQRLSAVSGVLRERHGVRLGAIIVDAVASGFVMEDENSAAEAGKIMRVLRRLGGPLGALVLGIAHYGKSAETGLRGSSAYRANADAMLSVLADRKEITGEVSGRELALAKSRVGVEGPVAPFALTFHVLGVDDDGDEFGACSVAPQLDQPSQFSTARAPRERPASRAVQAFRAAFSEAVDSFGSDISARLDSPPVRAVLVQHVRDEFARRYVVDETDPAKRRDAVRNAFKRALSALASEFPSFAHGDSEWLWSPSYTPASTPGRGQEH